MRRTASIASQLQLLIRSGAEDEKGMPAPPARQSGAFSDLRSYLLRVIGGIPLNPNDPDKRSATRECFAVISEDGHKDSIPHANRLQELWSDMVNQGHGKKLVVVRGERGSGKTATVNWLIDAHHEELLAQQITWFRTDILHLYTHNATESATGEVTATRRIGLGVYNLAHSIYVALAHGKNDPAFERIIGDVEGGDSFEAFLATHAPADNAIARIWSELLATWRSVEVSVRNRPLHLRGRTGEEAPHKQFVIEASEFLLRILLDRPAKFHEFQNYFNSYVNSHAPGGVWLFVDGVDNIDRQWGESLYADMLRELKELARDPHKAYTKIVMVMRSDTYEDFCRNHAIQLPEEPAYHTVEPLNPDLMFRHKPGVAFRPASGYFVPHRETTVKSIANAEKYLEALSVFYAVYVEYVAKWMHAFPRLMLTGAEKRLAPGAPGDRIWELAFNKSVRSFSRNVVVSYIYLLRLMVQRREGEGIAAISADDWIQSFSEQLRAKRPFIAEASILAGSDFGARGTERSKASAGRWCPNVFRYPVEDDYPHWGGLISLRIVQYVLSHKGHAAYEGKIIDVLARHFGYWESHVRSGIRMLREFGLLTVLVRGVGVQGGALEDGFIATHKAVFVFNLVFSDPSVTYFLAESSPVPPSIQERYFRHSPDHGPRNFHLATLRCGVAFLRLLRSVYDREMMALRAHLGPDLESAADRALYDTFCNHHIESDFEHWRHSMGSRIQALSWGGGESGPRTQADEMRRWIDAEVARTARPAVA